MIPIFVDADTRNSLVYASNPTITLNNPSDAADNTYLIEDIDVSPTYDMRSEPNSDRDGTQSGQPRKIQLMIAIRGWVKATSHAALYDKISALNRAFDPVLTHLSDSASTFDRGFVALDFNVPTADTANYASGLIASRYYCTSLKVPVPTTTKFDGLAARFVIILRCNDPRKYWQTLSEVSRTGTGTVTVTNTLGTYSSWPIIKIDFTTVPAGNITIVRQSHSATITLDYTKLADSSGRTLIIDTQARTAQYDNGTNKITALDPSSRFFSINPASAHTVTFGANTPADAVCRVIWRRAFV